MDLTAPTAPTYTAPASLEVGEAIAAMSPTGGADIVEYDATGLPSGLEINDATGVIGGTPDAANSSAETATVTVSDTAGNTDTVDIVFPAVDKGEQTLTGFEYSAASVAFNATAPTLTAPSGAQTALSYSADPSAVCTVDPSTGALTILGVGECVVTVTAAGTADWNAATDTFTVTVQAAGSLALNVDGPIAGDDTVNIAEKAAGFSISGDTGSDASVSVEVEIGTGTLNATSVDDGNGTAAWSVDVPADAAYIAGTSVDVIVSASKTGFADAPDVERTLAIDLAVPTAPTYTAPASLEVGEAIATMNPAGGADIAGYTATGLPSGLAINDATGVIGGTPVAADASTATAIVTVSDTAGNTAAVDIAFPSVDRGEQSLSGFRYSTDSATLGSAAPTVTAPTGFETTLSYTATPAAVCTVGDSTGALTLVGIGICEIAATAASDTNWNAATARFTVTVAAAGTLVLNVDPIAGDDTVNIAEKAAGFSISGDTGTETGVSVSAAIGTDTLTATSADDSGTATWSVNVPADAAYITGTDVDVTVSASKTGFTAPPDIERSLTIDLTAPTAPTYTAPASLKVGEAIVSMSPSGGANFVEYSATGLPSGLIVDSGTGVISGTPDAADSSTATATVTVSATAGNIATVDIVFPAVAKGEQSLSGFRYSTASVTLGSEDPTVSAPNGVRTTLSYSAAPAAVCTVDDSTGELTLVGIGNCEITATAVGTDDYNQATATFTVTVESSGPRSTAVALAVEPASLDENAGATAVTVTASLNEAPRSSDTVVTVALGAGDDTATAGTDYAAVDDMTVTIEAGRTSGTATFTLTPVDDSLLEADEALTVTGVTGAADLAVNGTVITIVDDDTKRRVSITPTSLTVPEGGTATYTVVLTSQPTATVRVTLSGTTDTDLRQNRTTLSFFTFNWDRPQTVTVSARQDDDTEDDIVTISHAVSGADYGANGVTADDVTVTIDDDDSVSPGVELTANRTSIGESAGFTGIVVTGTLNGAPRAETTTIVVTVGAEGGHGDRGRRLRRSR